MYNTQLHTLNRKSHYSEVLDCDIVVKKFELHKRYYVHFRTNILEKGMNLHILPAMDWMYNIL